MTRTVKGALGVLLIAASAFATSAYARPAHQTKGPEALRAYRGTYNDAQPLLHQRNIENFGFSGWDPSRVGGDDPNLRPSGS